MGFGECLERSTRDGLTTKTAPAVPVAVVDPGLPCGRGARLVDRVGIAWVEERLRVEARPGAQREGAGSSRRETVTRRRGGLGPFLGSQIVP